MYSLGPSFPRLFVRHLPETETKRKNCPCVKDIWESRVGSIGGGNGVLEPAYAGSQEPSVQCSGVLNPMVACNQLP